MSAKYQTTEAHGLDRRLEPGNADDWRTNQHEDQPEGTEGEPRRADTPDSTEDIKPKK